MTTPTGKPVPLGKIRQDLAEPNTKSTTDAAEGTGLDALFKVCSVQRVDPKRMVVDLITLTGGVVPYPNVSLTFGSAGARTFCGVLPQVNDNCVVGFAPKESGRTRQPYIVGWLIPGTDVGYDWVSEQPASPLEQPGTKAMDDRLEGLFTRRRHKLHNFAPGNGLMSSAQGADLVLDESATLVNRRGNELVLRDQDQALVVRSLQQFHAGAGFRVYGGMVQRDATFLPTQMFGDEYDWSSYSQVSAEGNPISFFELGDNTSAGYLTPATVFLRDPETSTPVNAQIVSPAFDPFSFLQRGSFITPEGVPFDDLVQSDAVYGGKSIFRVCRDAGSENTSRPNAVLGTVPALTEYRIEVAHTSDGTLPVTDQTDGLDVDRFPNTGPEAEGNSDNVAEGAAFVEFVLGTAVGNDPHGSREQYGQPLVAQIYKDGEYDPKIVSGRDAPESDQLAVLMRVRDVTGEGSPAFWAITKGGALKSYFPGSGSETAQEHYQTGKTVHTGSTDAGMSYSVEANGCVSLTNAGQPRIADNIGAELVSKVGGLKLFGGGVINENGNTAPPTDSDAAAAQSQAPAPAVNIQSAVDTLIEAPNGQTFIRSPKIFLDNASSITEVASSLFNMSSGDTMNFSTNTMNTTVNGKAVNTFGGPKDGLPTSGALRETKFTGTPLTGCLGGAVDEQSITYGGRSEEQTLGKRQIQCTVGGIQLESMTPGNPLEIGAGSGIELQTGPPGINNALECGLTSVEIGAKIPGSSVSMQALAGAATVHGSLTATVRSVGKVGLQAPYVGVTVPGAPGGVLTDACIDSLTGMPFIASGTVGTPTFRVGG
jgi:hypothetical protein